MLFRWPAWVLAGEVEPRKTPAFVQLYRRYVCEHVLCGEKAKGTAAALRQRCNVASSWAMDIICRRLRLTVPGYSAQARTALRCARVCTLILACLRGTQDQNDAPYA